MKISFVMPLPMSKPVGGFRIVYEYAERLSLRGHRTTIYYPIAVPILKYRRPFIMRCLKALICRKRIANWFEFKGKVEFKVIPRIDDGHIENGDVVVATAVPTAYEVAKLDASKGDKIYLIQHYEIWDGVELADNSYKLKLRNIVVAKWLGDKLKEVGAPVEAYIPNAIDLGKYRILNGIDDRDRLHIATIFHKDPSKGSCDALKALEMVTKRHPGIKATIFSVFKKPATMPRWVEYIRDPGQSEIIDIYNKTAIFVSSSITEGFGLPGMEALACGCALTTTDSLGVREYAIHEETALLSPPADPESLATNIIRLIEDDRLRKNLALNGNRAVQRFAWDGNVDRMEAIIMKRHAEAGKSTGG